MVDLIIEENEHIIRRTKEAWSFDGDEERELKSLVLTNKHLISVYEKSVALIFKGETIVDKKPLSLISTIDDVLQVKNIIDDNFGESLQILFDNGMEELYFFGDAPKSEYQQWESAIKKAVIENNRTVIQNNEIPASPLSSEENKQVVPVTMVEEKVSKKGDTPVYCTSCGAKNNVGARFCQSCGTFLNAENKPRQTEESRKEDPYQQSTYSGRRQEFAGKIIKCPNCGEILKSFVANCPSCGFEIRGTKATSSVREFALKLEAIESKRSISEGKKHSFIAKIYGSDGKLTDTDEQKISLIRSFSVPNTREDILEFMILASSNVDVSIYGWGDQGVITESRKAVSEAWIAKMEQVYEKAKLTFGNAPEFQNIEKSYLKKMMAVKKRKRGIWVTLVGINVGLWGFIALISLMPKPTLEKQIENRQEHLEFVVDQIEDDIVNGEFTDARNKAYTLTFDEELDLERHNYWEQKQQDILEQIEKASREKAD